MKKTVKQLHDDFKLFIGDSTSDIPIEFFIQALNWACREIPRIPGLQRAFSRHYTFNLMAKNAIRWDLTGESFRKLNDIIYLNVYTSTGGEPCLLTLCEREPIDFYRRNGLVEAKKAGIPCEYTLEREGDATYFILDRPSNVPLILDYIACGYPKEAASAEDEIDISATIQNLIFSAIQNVYYHEAADFGFAQDITNYFDNKMVPEAMQELNRVFHSEAPRILGEA